MRLHLASGEAGRTDVRRMAQEIRSSRETSRTADWRNGDGFEVVGERSDYRIHAGTMGRIVETMETKETRAECESVHRG